MCSRGFPFSVHKENGKHDSKMNGSTTDSPRFKPAPRIVLSTAIMQEFVNGINLALFKWGATQDAAKQALNALHSRASYELDTEILVSTNALQHILLVESMKETVSPQMPPSQEVKIV